MNCDCPKEYDEYGRLHLTSCRLWKPLWVRRGQAGKGPNRDKTGGIYR